MAKIVVNKCPHTGILFEDDREYRNHMQKVRRNGKLQAEYMSMFENIDDIVLGASQVFSVQELCNYVMEHSKAFVLNGILRQVFDAQDIHKAMQKGWQIDIPKLRGIGIHTEWRDDNSNTHNCPRDGVTNFFSRSNDDNLPTGYPGWYGKISTNWEKGANIVITRPSGRKKRFGFPGISNMVGERSDGRVRSGICTGSGSGGSFSDQYSVTLFEDDFPNMKKQVLFTMIQDSDSGNTRGWNGSPVYDKLNVIGKGFAGKGEMECQS